MVEMIPVESSNIAAVGHDGTDLFIEFKRGNVYQYKNVGRDVFEEMLVAESVGKFFHAEIRGGGYTHEKVE